jgi:hypothetical protein
VDLPAVALDGYLNQPESPSECIFAATTACVSADLETKIGPCQFGGQPVCSECGCLASAALAGIGRHRVAGLMPIANLFAASLAVGNLASARTAAA